MQQNFAITQKSRETLVSFLDNYSVEQLNKIPDGFNNNLFWNLAHIIVVQQMLVYNLSGLPMVISNEMVAKYKRGTKPEENVGQSQIDEIRNLLFDTVKTTQADYANGIFKDYQSFSTMTGFRVDTVEEAINFNNYHEGVHTGVMMAIGKLV